MFKITKKEFINLMNNRESLLCGYLANMHESEVMTKINSISENSLQDAKINSRVCKARSNSLIFTDKEGENSYLNFENFANYYKYNNFVFYQFADETTVIVYYIYG